MPSGRDIPLSGKRHVDVIHLDAMKKLQKTMVTTIGSHESPF
jgi:hypothetical protein